MTPAEKILREALDRIATTKYGIGRKIAREAIVKVDALPIDYRIPGYLQNDPWALQVMGYIDGLKAKVDASNITGEKALEVSEKIVTNWLAEVGSDEHGIDWDDLADLKNRIAKALTKA